MLDVVALQLVQIDAISKTTNNVFTEGLFQFGRFWLGPPSEQRSGETP